MKAFCLLWLCIQVWLCYNLNGSSQGGIARVVVVFKLHVSGSALVSMLVAPCLMWVLFVCLVYHLRVVCVTKDL